ncbi:hypothetical protein [Microbacterium oxydans]|uniref:hypothetical protein n=1 Tax=Microbacterium oxydans TaxID=82380 RepID=UPI003D8033BE
MSEQTAIRARALGTRWLGVGLAAVISVVTLGLGLTGRLNLYISPESVWFACTAAVVTLAGAIWSCTLPLGEEGDHGHDHGPAPEVADTADDADHGSPTASPRRSLAGVGAVAGGVIATGVVAAALVLPPASLSVELAMSRAGGAERPVRGVGHGRARRRRHIDLRGGRLGERLRRVHEHRRL